MLDYSFLCSSLSLYDHLIVLSPWKSWRPRRWKKKSSLEVTSSHKFLFVVSFQLKFPLYKELCGNLLHNSAGIYLGQRICLRSGISLATGESRTRRMKWCSYDLWLPCCQFSMVLHWSKSSVWLKIMFLAKLTF